MAIETVYTVAEREIRQREADFKAKPTYENSKRLEEAQAHLDALKKRTWY